MDMDKVEQSVVLVCGNSNVNWSLSTQTKGEANANDYDLIGSFANFPGLPRFGECTETVSDGPFGTNDGTHQICST